METAELIDVLGYAGSPHYLPVEDLGEAPEHAHIFRRAVSSCSLRGVYLLRDASRPVASSTSTPVVYVAQADSVEDADRIHRKVWNQNIVPFLVVRIPRGVRLYSGFRYGRPHANGDEQAGVLEAAVRFQEVNTKLAAFRARAIDDGTLWRIHGAKVEPEGRVDLRLLDNLEALGQWLRDRGLKRNVAHSLIGKLVYLRYLRDREILSDRRLSKWKIEPDKVFGRSPVFEEIRRLFARVEDWLNGEIFPLPLSGRDAPGSKHVERAAAVFLGDDVRTGQLHIDFQAYDFSHIPIETLSVIYEQFLALEGKRRKTGAYYTPIPIVNFMLAELEDYKPLRQGVRVLDPSCGSGAFLVQCYRRLVERQTRVFKRKLKPSELRDLLVRHIYGIDRDLDACRVTELSLILTMLDYIEPPDLHSTPTFQLPRLHNKNIYESDFCDPSSKWSLSAERHAYDYVLGNPPWIKIDMRSDKSRDLYFRRWLEHREHPVTDNQAAEIFAWEAMKYAAADGIVALLLPAMTLFKRSRVFRKEFVFRADILSVCNFSNFRRDLFVKRVGGKTRKMEVPAVAVFYRSPRKEASIGTRSIAVYSPLLANHESNRPAKTSRRKKIWNLTLNASEISFVDTWEISDGSALAWKLAAWGTSRDKRLIRQTTGRFDTLSSWARKHDLNLSEGIQLRKQVLQEEESLVSKSSSSDGSNDERSPGKERIDDEEIEPAPEVVGENRLLMKRLAGVENLYSFPPDALEKVPAAEGFVRKGRKERPLAVCRPPHVIVSAERNFAIYTDDFIVVPPRQIGISGSREQGLLLKALALYLRSDFARYFEFFFAPQSGVRGELSTLATLRSLPTPLGELSSVELKQWGELYSKLVIASESLLANKESPLFSTNGVQQDLRLLQEDMNQKVNAALGLTDEQQWLVEDFIHIKLYLNDGRLGEPAVCPPSAADLNGYAAALKAELDGFLVGEPRIVHRIRIFNGATMGAIEISIDKDSSNTEESAEIFEAEGSLNRELEQIRSSSQIDRQWIYFDRNLFAYTNSKTYLFKPRQRVWWTRSQAMSDADEMIAAALSPEGDK